MFHDPQTLTLFKFSIPLRPLDSPDLVLLAIPNTPLSWCTRAPLFSEDLGVNPHVVMSATTTSTFTTTTLVGTRSAMTNASITSEQPCPTCGGHGNLHDPAEAQHRIQELEGQIQELNERAAVTGKLQPDPWFCSLKRACRMPASRLGLSFQSRSRFVDSGLVANHSPSSTQPANSPTTKRKYTNCAPHKSSPTHREAVPRCGQHHPKQRKRSHRPKFPTPSPPTQHRNRPSKSTTADWQP